MRRLIIALGLGLAFGLTAVISGCPSGEKKAASGSEVTLREARKSGPVKPDPSRRKQREAGGNAQG